MQFKHPEVFYFLFLLLIPLIIHLFELQRFKKVAFTNVAFLKKISLETRKSSKLKKWLILCTRILGLLAILFTFSQPYFSENSIDQKKQYFIYLDNSMSLNTNGNNGNSLMLAAKDIIESAPEIGEFSLVTNEEIHNNLNKNELSNLLKKISFSTKKNNLTQKILQIEGQIKNKNKTLSNIILISDFQFFNKKIKSMFTNVNIDFSLVKIKNKSKNNISIDSIFISNNEIGKFQISAVVKNQGDQKKNVPIALYNGEILVSKRSFSIDENSTGNIEFTIPETAFFSGKLKITYSDIFTFDNVFNFTINSQQKTPVLCIGKPPGFLSKIFTDDDFNFTNSSLLNVNYNSIQNQQLIVLNELKNIPTVLQNTLQKFIENGGHLLIIPDKEVNIASYNSFFNRIGKGYISRIRKDSLKITGINYAHPIYRGVFSKKVANFQYPTVTMSYQTSLQGDQIITYENKTAFLQEIQNPYSKIYWFSTPLDPSTTNFSNSPLIVPTLYNIGQQSLRVTKPYYTLQQENSIEINQKLGQDEILTISSDEDTFIPMQESFANKVRLITTDRPKHPGFYNIVLKDKPIQTIAYNIASSESGLYFYELEELKKSNANIKTFDSIKQLFNEINEKNEVQWLWKLFLAIAIVSLLLEILILKFFKT